MITGLGAYYRPDRLEEALQLLAQEPECEVLAGGTDLLLADEPRQALVDITRLGLDGLAEEGGDLVLGATLTIQRLLDSPLARSWADGVLAGACLEFGTLQVRNVATVGGNVAQALPAADLVPALMALDAEVSLARAGEAGSLSWRRLSLDGFATGPHRTILQPGELLSSVRLPARTRTWRAQFRKVGRGMKDLAQVNSAVALEIAPDSGGGRVRQARLVVGAVHPTVVRVPVAEAELVGARPGGDDWPARAARAADAVRAFVEPITDQRATREWRRYVCGVLVRRSLEYLGDPSTAGRAPRLEDGPSYRIGLGADGTP